jgi:hypothetical protein
MDKHSNDPASIGKQSALARALAKNYSAPLAGVALSALSAWLIVTGLKGLAGFAVNQQTALADLVGIVLVVGIARWFATRRNTK